MKATRLSFYFLDRQEVNIKKWQAEQRAAKIAEKRNNPWLSVISIDDTGEVVIDIKGSRYMYMVDAAHYVWLKPMLKFRPGTALAMLKKICYHWERVGI